MWVWKLVTPVWVCCSLSLSHSMTCLCLLNNGGVQRRERATRRLTRGDEKRAVAVSGPTPNTLTHQSGWGVWKCVCGSRASVHKMCEGSTVNHPSNEQNSRSNQAVILLLGLRSHDVIGKYSSATTKWIFGYKSEREHWLGIHGFSTADDKTHTYTYPQLTKIWKYIEII